MSQPKGSVGNELFTGGGGVPAFTFRDTVISSMTRVGFDLYFHNLKKIPAAAAGGPAGGDFPAKMRQNRKKRPDTVIPSMNKIAYLGLFYDLAK